MWHLFRLCKKLRLRASEYKSHRIFTLRCLHNDLIPTSIKLKSTLKSTRANKILRKAEKELLQTRVKSINYILDNTSQQLEECRSQLASIISTQRLRECQDFFDKVGEIRFNKVKQRQLNKFNLLINRKEGNITRSNNTNTNNLNSQSGSQINQSNLSNQISHTTSQVNPYNPSPANALLPPREGGNSPPATGHLLPEGTSLPQANSQVIGSQPTSQAMGSHPTLAIAHLPPREGSNSPLATVHPSSEGNSSPSIQASGGLPSPAIAHLPPGEGSNSLLAAVHLPSEDVSSSQATSLHIHRERNSSPQSPRSAQAGQGHNPPRAGRQGNRHPPGTSLHSPPRRPVQPPRKATPPWRPVQPPRKATPPPFSPVGPTKVLQIKNPTLSGSLTFPTNPWHQLKGLFWLKDPTLWLPLGSLLT